MNKFEKTENLSDMHLRICRITPVNWELYCIVCVYGWGEYHSKTKTQCPPGCKIFIKKKKIKNLIFISCFIIFFAWRIFSWDRALLSYAYNKKKKKNF